MRLSMVNTFEWECECIPTLSGIGNIMIEYTRTIFPSSQVVDPGLSALCSVACTADHKGPS